MKRSQASQRNIIFDSVFLNMISAIHSMNKASEQKKGRKGRTNSFFLSLSFSLSRLQCRNCCKQHKDTIPSWKKDFVANHFCHNAAHSPYIHYTCVAQEEKERISKESSQQDHLRVFRSEDYKGQPTDWLITSI